MQKMVASGHRLTRLAVGAAIACACGTSARAGTVTADFICGFDLGRAFFADFYAGAQNGITYAAGRGKLSVTQAAGAGNGGVDFKTTYRIEGDFTARVTVDPSQLGRAQAGLLIADPFGLQLMDIFFDGPGGTLQSVVFAKGGGGTRFIAWPGGPATLVIARHGNVMTSSYTAGGKTAVLQVSDSLAALGVAVEAAPFFVEEGNDKGAHAVDFSKFSVASKSLKETCSGPVI